jgi:hypothetical protein
LALRRLKTDPLREMLINTAASSFMYRISTGALLDCTDRICTYQELVYSFCNRPCTQFREPNS